jgi:uncharacterized protein YprB with RNaseH-like and TPR domain
VPLCWEKNYYGGLKTVETMLGITRILPNKSGLWAVKLWEKFIKTEDSDYLDLLLAYNAEDCYNLYKLKLALNGKTRPTALDGDGLPSSK